MRRSFLKTRKIGTLPAATSTTCKALGAKTCLKNYSESESHQHLRLYPKRCKTTQLCTKVVIIFASKFMLSVGWFPHNGFWSRLQTRGTMNWSVLGCLILTHWRASTGVARIVGGHWAACDMEVPWTSFKTTSQVCVGYSQHVIPWCRTSHECGLHPLPAIFKNPPAPKVLGRDLPDGTRKRLQVYLGGGHFSAKTSCFW